MLPARMRSGSYGRRRVLVPGPEKVAAAPESAGTWTAVCESLNKLIPKEVIKSLVESPWKICTAGRLFLFPPSSNTCRCRRRRLWWMRERTPRDCCILSGTLRGGSNKQRRGVPTLFYLPDAGAGKCFVGMWTTFPGFSRYLLRIY